MWIRTCICLLALAATAPAAERWQLVWHDEFDLAGAPDPTKWSYEFGRVRNGEPQFYTAARRENVRVEHGELIITARHERYRDADYTSASLTTQDKASWTYGRVAIRAKLPRGRGVWPAFWLLGDDRTIRWPSCGEIDIMEFLGREPGVVTGTVHTAGRLWFRHHAQYGGEARVADPHDTWHVYAVEWSPTEIRFLVDDRRYFTYENDGRGGRAWPFDRPEHLLIDLALSDGGDGRSRGIDDAIFPQRLRVDWVRVYRDTQAKR